jgi:excinuclease UvrABC nuclease subunit
MAIVAGLRGHIWSESSIKANAPQSSGVYAIYSAVWIYIGEADDIQRKLLQHWDGDNVYITCAVPTAFAFEVCNLAERVRRHVALIARFQPLCNQL